jgi:hypothetical protein
VFQTWLRRIAERLDASELEYLVIGGQALLLYGEPRLTQDIDITLGVGPEALDRLQTIVKQLGLRLLVEEVEPFVQRTWVLPVQDPDSGIRVDFIFSSSEYEREAMRRARSVTIEGYPIRFASLEDLIVHKVVAGRPRDLEDLRGVLRRQRDVDRDYVRRWLKDFDRQLATDYERTFQTLLEEVDHE